MNSDLKYFLKVLTTTLLCGVIIFCLIMLYLMTYHESLEGEFTPLENIRNKMRTGDLVIYDNESLPSRMVKTLVGSKFSHVGIIVKQNKEIKIIEAGVYPKTDYKGVYIIPIDEWIEINEFSRKGWLRLKRDRIIRTKDLLQAFEAIREAKFSSDMVEWKNTLSWFKKDYIQEEPRSRMFCAEVVAYLLQEVGQLKKEWTPYSYSPIDFERSGIYDKVIPII